MLDLVAATDITPNALSFVLMEKQNSASFYAGDTHIRFDSLSLSMEWPLDLSKLVASYIIPAENAVATLLADNFSTDRFYTYCPRQDPFLELWGFTLWKLHSDFLYEVFTLNPSMHVGRKLVKLIDEITMEPSAGTMENSTGSPDRAFVWHVRCVTQRRLLQTPLLTQIEQGIITNIRCN